MADLRNRAAVAQQVVNLGRQGCLTGRDDLLLRTVAEVGGLTLGQARRVGWPEASAVVMTTLQSSKAPSLPKGLPAVPSQSTVWLVFIAAKQWRKVRRAIEADAKDKLIIDGYPVFDAGIGGGTMCLYAQSVTTTALQRARWAEKK